jgi:hypothetical protein
MLHVEPNVAFEALVMYGTGAVTPTAILLNASHQYPNGYGFKVKWGENIALLHTPLLVANDLVFLSRSRSDVLNKYGMTTGAEGYLLRSEEALQEAMTALMNYQYDLARNSAIYSWALQLRSYVKIKEGTSDAINTVILSYLALIPFSLLMERFLFGYGEWRRRLFAILGIFGIMMAFLVLFHPGFSLASNAYVSLLGCTILILTLPLLAMLGSRFSNTLASIRVERLGKHFMEIARVSATSTAFESGIRSMKKHQLQAVMTIISLVLISASLVALTSLRVAPFVYKLAEQGNPYYVGISFRDIGWSPLSREFIEYLKSHFLTATVIPRSYAYIASWQLGTMVEGPKGKSSFAIIVGFTGQDPIWNAGALVRGRVFAEDDMYATILVEDVADLLGVDVGDSIKFEGLELRVVGIASRQILGSLMEPDRYPIYPKDQRFETLQFYSPLDTLMVPYQLAIYMGGTPGSALIIQHDPVEIVSMASELADLTGMELCIATEVGLDVPVYRMATARAYESTGFLTMIIPLVVAMFIVLNMMLGIVAARRNEMTILSCVGLAPIHVVGMFFAESITYGFAGSIIGYTLGIVLTKFTAGIMREISVNYASNFVILTIGMTIGAVILSSIYPLIKVSKLVTPSLSRKWAFPTRPIGDSWDIPLPFTTHNDDEVKGILIFLSDWFNQHDIEDVDAKFTAREIKLVEESYDKQLAKKLVGVAHLAPFPAGIHIDFEVSIVKDEGSDRWTSIIHERRRSGEYSAWVLSTRIFVDEIRKQFLIWRSLTPEEKYKFSVRWVSTEISRKV